MKKKIIISVVIVSILGVVVFLYFKSSQTKTNSESNASRTSSQQIETKTDETEGNKEENLAVSYKLSDNEHILKIEKDNNIYIKNTTFSTPENVNIAFSDTDFDMSNLPLSYMMVVPTDFVKTKTDKLKLSAKYEDNLQEFMAFNSSTQCAMLKPEDFKQEEISGYKVWVANRTDKCTFRVDEPYTQVINMLGFETNGYTVVLSVSGKKEEIPENAEEMMKTVVSLTIVE